MRITYDPERDYYRLLSEKLKVTISPDTLPGMIAALRVGYFRAHNVHLGGDSDDAGFINHIFDILADPNSKSAYDTLRGQFTAQQRQPPGPSGFQQQPFEGGEWSFSYHARGSRQPIDAKVDIPTFIFVPTGEPFGVRKHLTQDQVNKVMENTVELSHLSELLTKFVPFTDEFPGARRIDTPHYFDIIKLTNQQKIVMLATCDCRWVATNTDYIGNVSVSGYDLEFSELGGTLFLPRDPNLMYSVEIKVHHHLRGTVAHSGFITSSKGMEIIIQNNLAVNIMEGSVVLETRGMRQIRTISREQVFHPISDYPPFGNLFLSAKGGIKLSYDPR